jgi:uncharacterized protein YxeA
MKRLMKMLVAVLLLVTLSAPAWAAEEADALQKDDLFQGTDQFSKDARSVTEVNLDKRMLAMMDKFTSAAAASKGEKAELNLAKKMDFVYVRSYEFEKPGQYKAADLDAFRKRLEGADWSHIVKERTKDEQNDVWVRIGDEGQFAELVVISAEANELNFVHLKGHMTLQELESAGAKFGVPQSAVQAPEKRSK